MLNEKKIQFQTLFPARLRVFRAVQISGRSDRRHGKEGTPSGGHQTPGVTFGAGSALNVVYEQDWGIEKALAGCGAMRKSYRLLDAWTWSVCK